MEENKQQIIQKYLFKIPSLDGKESKNYVIGVIDASGSMSSYWEWLANVWNNNLKEDMIHKIITFDSQPKIAPSAKLSTKINDHGGGMTNISKAFKEFEKQLEQIPLNASCTCIFISDGQDNNLNTLEKRMSELKGNLGRHVNFICLGVQSGFPTFLSMNLRKLYHNGDESIPALYLIEYASEKAFFNKFQTILPFLKGASLLDVIPPCRIYPWEEPKTELYEGSWVITEENYVCINDQKFEVDPNKVGIDNLVEIFRNWLQNLHLICLKDAKAGIQNAKLTLPEIHNQLDIYAKISGTDLRKIEVKENSGFFDSALANFMKNFGQRVNWFIEEIEKLAKGDNPKDLSEFEAAKRIQLGTITGKHQQKALALKNITTTDFKQIKENFIKIYQDCKINIDDEKEDQFPYCSQTMKKLFLEKKFIDAFEYCASQYDLFDALNLPGISVYIKRNDGFETNPWLISVKNLKFSMKNTESAKIITNSYLLSIPIPDSDKKEEINCCLPLFTKKDQELMPLFTHQLIQMIISHLLTMNADAYYEDAYFSLLAHAYIAMINDQQKVDYYQVIEDAIFESFELVYQDKIKQFSDELENKPQAFFNQQFQQQNYLSSISKAYFLISYLNKKQFDVSKFKKMYENMLLLWCFEFLKENKYNVKNFFNENFDQQKIIEEARKEFNNSLYLSSFQKIFGNVVSKLSTGSYSINQKYLEDFNSEIELPVLSKFYKELFNEEIQKDTYLINLDHSMKYKEEIFTNEKNQNIEQATEFFKQQVSSKPYKGKNKKEKKCKGVYWKNGIVNACYKQLQADYIQKFMEEHSEVLPMSKQEIENECKNRNIDFNLIKFSNSNLPSNMCLSPKCHFFFTILPETKDPIQTSLKKHMDNWQGLKPQSFHKIIFENKDQNAEKIYQTLKEKEQFNENKYKVSKEFTLQYIEKVRLKYCNIDK